MIFRSATTLRPFLIVICVGGLCAHVDMLIISWCCSDCAFTGQETIPPLLPFTPSLRISIFFFFCGGIHLHLDPWLKRRLFVDLSCVSRQHFKLLVDELHVKGEGKVKKAMKESFKILNEVCAPFATTAATAGS